MIVGSLDGESCRFRDGLKSPPPVCFQWHSETEEGIAVWHEQEEFLRRILTQADVICGVNLAYDTAMILNWHPTLAPLVWDAYNDGRIIELGIYERLGEVARGRPRGFNSLDMMSRRYGIGGLDKDPNGPRTDYGRLIGLPISAWPQRHVDYAIEDVRVGLELFRRQHAKLGEHVPWKQLQLSSQYHLWMALTSGWGLRSDATALKHLSASVHQRLDELTAMAKKLKFVRDTGSTDQAAIRKAVFAAYEGRPPMTEESKDRAEKQEASRKKWQAVLDDPTQAKMHGRARSYLARQGPFVPRVSIAKDTLIMSGDEALMTLAGWGEIRAVANKDLKLLEGGVHTAIHTRFGLANTLRTTTSSPNIQNFGRKGGARECITPREGTVLISADVTGLEMATLAQVLYSKFGMRALLDKINGGVNVHSEIGAELMNLSYEEFEERRAKGDDGLDESRDCGKIANFGYPGGMGAETMVLFALKSYSKDLGQVRDDMNALQFAKHLKRLWTRKNPDIAQYLRNIRRFKNTTTGLYDFELPMVGMMRRGATFCSTANGHFQGPGAALMKEIMWQIVQECFNVPSSALWGSRPVNFVHDEVILETPLTHCHTAGQRMVDIFNATFPKFCPDVRMETEAIAQWFWSKKASPRHDERGRLIPWPVRSDIPNLKPTQRARAELCSNLF